VGVHIPAVPRVAVGGVNPEVPAPAHLAERAVESVVAVVRPLLLPPVLVLLEHRDPRRLAVLVGRVGNLDLAQVPRRHEMVVLHLPVEPDPPLPQEVVEAAIENPDEDVAPVGVLGIGPLLPGEGLHRPRIAQAGPRVLREVTGAPQAALPERPPTPQPYVHLLRLGNDPPRLSVPGLGTVDAPGVAGGREQVRYEGLRTRDRVDVE